MAKRGSTTNTSHRRKKSKKDESNLNAIIRTSHKEANADNSNKANEANSGEEEDETQLEDELKQCRCAVRMAADGAFDGHNDVDLNLSESPRKHVCKIITGLEIGCAHNEFYDY